MNSQQVQFDTLRSLANGSISGTYAAVGSPLIYPARIISLVNNTAGDMIFSTDGVNDMLFLPNNSYKIYDFSANRLAMDGWFSVPAGTQFYVKQSTAPMSGAVYIEVIYGINSVKYTGKRT